MLKSLLNENRLRLRFSTEFRLRIPLKIGGVTLPQRSPRASPAIATATFFLHAFDGRTYWVRLLLATSGSSLTSVGSRAGRALTLLVFLKEAIAASRSGPDIPSSMSIPTLILAAPKIGPAAVKIREHVAQLLGIDPSAVSVKAKTPEGMGTDHAAIAHAIVLLQKISS